MVKLTERERIEILCMIGFGDRIHTQKEVVGLFNETHLDWHPISQSMVIIYSVDEYLFRKIDEHY
ncbi:hypothetical protein NQ318_003608 [Aromia moschata]|uniref:Uncharacterized protein n=1 Tax=Aromia moschata TaxID=1265417 RepID=A0AAV8Y4Z5_9CUCU|nr:hypothetical protein NQ318_003608 [Aromia moschata]